VDGCDIEDIVSVLVDNGVVQVKVHPVEAGLFVLFFLPHVRQSRVSDDYLSSLRDPSRLLYMLPVHISLSRCITSHHIHKDLNISSCFQKLIITLSTRHYNQGIIQKLR
jgi:hypothetical protein